MKLKYIILLLAIAGLFSCKKDWLDIKPDKALIVPTTLEDFQALLDNSSLLNQNPPLPELGADDYFVTNSVFLSLRTVERNAYIWAQDIYEGDRGFDWERCYQRVYYANIVLEELENNSATLSSQPEWNNVKGQALFTRAFAYYYLVHLFAKPYDPSTASTDLGVPLKLSPDINNQVKRSSIQQSYQQILNDLEMAIPLLPSEPLFKLRSSKAAAHGLLARMYLHMGNYEKAWFHSNASLLINNSLINFNTLNPSSNTPFSRLNEEVIFHAISAYSSRIANAHIDTILLDSYETQDLRKVLFFRNVSGTIRFKGSYNSNTIPFTGITTSELYLIRAEASARKDNTQNAAMNDLNTLLETRWKTGTFIPLVANSTGEALELILMERRKELIFRDLRWFDLRRLNKEPAFAKTLVRHINGQTYTLPPNDPYYVYPIPDNEIQLSGIEQNAR